MLQQKNNIPVPRLFSLKSHSTGKLIKLKTAIGQSQKLNQNKICCKKHFSFFYQLN